MKKKLICGFILSVLMILPINLFAINIDVSGYWEIFATTNGESGESGPSYLQLQQFNENISGTWLCEDSEKITGSINGTEISISWTENTGVTVTAIGNVSGSTMAGTWTETSGGSGTWSSNKSDEPSCISSSSVYGVWVITDQWKFVDGTIRKRIMTEIEINEQGNTVFGADISNSGKVSFISGPLDDWGYWGEYRSFGKSWDPETPGLDLPQWMNETFDFAFHASDGDKHSFLTTTDEFAWLPFLDLKLVRGGKNPTFKWNEVASADQYRVRIVNPEGSGVLIDDRINADGSDSYTYTYSGNLFSQYNKLIFRIEARDYDLSTGEQLTNRSVVFYEHSALKAMPFVPLLLDD